MTDLIVALAAARAEVRRETIEECARLASSFDERPYEFTEYHRPGFHIAAAIRALLGRDGE